MRKYGCSLQRTSNIHSYTQRLAPRHVYLAVAYVRHEKKAREHPESLYSTSGEDLSLKIGSKALLESEEKGNREGVTL